MIRPFTSAKRSGAELPWPTRQRHAPSGTWGELLPIAWSNREAPPAMTAHTNVGEEGVDRTFTVDVGGSEKPADSGDTLPQSRRLRHKSWSWFSVFVDGGHQRKSLPTVVAETR